MDKALMAKVRGLIGLSARAGQLTFGEDGCVAAIRGRKAALVLVDEGASANTRKRYADCCRSYGCPLALLPEGLLAQAAGRSGRMAAACGPGPLTQGLKETLANHLLVLS